MAWLRKQLAEAEPDLLREMVRSFAEALMGATGVVLAAVGWIREGGRAHRALEH